MEKGIIGIMKSGPENRYKYIVGLKLIPAGSFRRLEFPS